MTLKGTETLVVNDGGNPVPTTVAELSGYTVTYMPTISSFGAVGDGTTNDDEAFEHIDGADKLVYVPRPTTGYTFSGDVFPQDRAFFIDPTITWDELTDGGKLNIWRGRYTDAPTGANIWRFSDRVFVGYAAAEWAGNSTSTPDAGGSWLAAAADGPGYLAVNAGVVFMNGVGDSVNLARNQPYGIVSAVSTANVDGDTIAFGAAVIAEDAHTGWAYIAELQRESGAGSVYGIEFAAKNKGSNGVATPNTLTTGGPGGVYGIWAAGGGDDAFGGAPTNPSTAVVAILNNTTTWNAGIVVASNALTDGKVMVMSSEGTGGAHNLSWMNALGNTVFSISADTTDTQSWSMARTSAGLEIRGTGGTGIATFVAGGTPVNYLAVTSAPAGSGVLLSSVGTDSNSGIRMRGKGTGGATFQDGASAVKFSYNTTGIGFFAATPVVKQTVGAALSTGGAETNTNLATRINELRTALINYGLAV